jgi:predicted RNA binding protein YcfA (HicA-like mRNA interferase family)
MSTLPKVSGREVAKVFEKFGWRIVRQRGSHMIMVKDEQIATLSIPDHNQVAKGTLRGLIRSAGLTVTEFSNAAAQL